MKIDIGSAYEGITKQLVTQMKSKAAAIEPRVAERHACYLCGKHISEWMWVLSVEEEQNGRKSTSEFYIDNLCYTKARANSAATTEAITDEAIIRN
jgi:hypothetical protein